MPSAQRPATLLNRQSYTLEHYISAGNVTTPEEVLRRLVPIGIGPAEFFINWDTGRKGRKGEFQICLLDSEDDWRIYYCGSDLLDFLSVYLLGGKLYKVCPRLLGYECEPMFHAVDMPKKRKKRSKKTGR